ncbi:DUF7518 family protein [Natronomonas sp.]|uniref:DUF7518 family protein n=1 Tax=Natronomonas sp. TaxID=2184060 RepID=UPI00261C2D33|nr:bZIP transcription factor [Natronomonas sp.]
MSGNRVEKLEAKVRELEATIEGLTDELVETKERLAAIEDETGVELDVFERRRPGEAGSNEAGAPEGAGAGTEPTDGGETATDGSGEDAESESESGDDIIVA